MKNTHNDLKERILSKIGRTERRRLAFKAAGFGVTLAGSISVAVFSYFELMSEAAQSGLWSFTSLLFSDFSSIVANFSDFAFSILESFPVFSAALLLSGIFFAVWSAARFANEIVSIRELRPFSLKHIAH